MVGGSLHQTTPLIHKHSVPFRCNVNITFSSNRIALDFQDGVDTMELRFWEVIQHNDKHKNLPAINITKKFSFVLPGGEEANPRLLFRVQFQHWYLFT
jgi:hypothetical protein